jgi:CBS domain-containing protein
MPHEIHKRESGRPGDGAGRKDDVRGSGVYPMSGPYPPGNAPTVGQAGWGQGERGPTGYQDHGESELSFPHVRPERCRDIMTKDPACCLPGTSAAQAAELMLMHDIGILPVVTSKHDKDLVGVITDRDLALTLVADGSDPVRTPVELIMTRHPIVCSPDDAYQKVLQTMEEHRIRRVPVVDHAGRLVGILSQADVALRVRDDSQLAELVREISQPVA